MGQRLVITVENNQEELAKIYYHWGAYTLSALEYAKDIIDYLAQHPSLDIPLALIRYAESNGGGIDYSPEQLQYLYLRYPAAIFKTKDMSRNDGLVAVTPKAMEDVQSCSEGDLWINIDTKIIENSLFFTYDSLDILNNDLGLHGDVRLTLAEIPEINYDPRFITFDDLPTVINSMSADLQKNDYFIYDETIFTFIC